MDRYFVPTIVLIIGGAFAGFLVTLALSFAVAGIDNAGLSAGTGWGCLAGLIAAVGYYVKTKNEPV